MTTTWGLAASGTDIGQYAALPASLAALMSTPPARGKNITAPGRHGTIVTRKLYGAGGFVLPLWLRGSLADGTVPVGSSQKAELYHRADELVGLFPVGDTVPLDHTLPDATVRRANVEVADSIDFTRNLGTVPVWAKVSVSLEMPYPFWADLTDTTDTFSVATGGTHVLTGFAASTAPMDELTITFGPGNNPLITDTATGVFFAYDGVISAGRQLVVNTADWSLDDGAGTAWSPDYSAVRHGGSARWFELAALSTGPVVGVTHTTGGSISVTVAGKRKYLTA